MSQNPRKIIKKLFDEDQKDRKVWRARFGSPTKTAWKKIEKRDRKRIKKLKLILKLSPLLRGIDYFYAGIISQHGITLSEIKIANELAKKGFALGDKRAAWLHAASTDRILMMQGKKQKFGTQYQLKEGKWILYPVRSGVSDTVRKKYNVISLVQAKKKTVELNEGRGKLGRVKRVGITRRN